MSNAEPGCSERLWACSTLHPEQFDWAHTEQDLEQMNSRGPFEPKLLHGYIRCFFVKCVILEVLKGKIFGKDKQTKQPQTFSYKEAVVNDL